MVTNRHDVEIAKIVAGERKVAMFTDLLGRLGFYGMVLGVFYCMISGLKYLTDDNVGAIEAVGNLIEKFDLDGILGAIGTTTASTYALFANRNARRAYREKAKFQKLAEANEQNRTSSGLTEEGKTPK